MTEIDPLSLTFEGIRMLGRDIRVHGNGFVQIDMPDSYRVHLWGHPDVPRQRQSSPVHDHAWHMRSWVLRGRLVNSLWSLISTGEPDHEVCTPVVRTGQDTTLQKTGQVGRLSKKQYPQMIMERESYDVSVGTLHETWVSVPTVTVIHRTTPDRRDWDRPVRVLVPIGREPDNNFVRYDAPAERLWQIAEEMMR